MESAAPPRFPHAGPWLWFTAGLGMLAGIGWLDAVTGPDLGLSLLYLVPVCLAGWWSGPVSALLLALSASFCWLGVDLGTQGAPDLRLTFWNWTSRAVIYVALGVLLALLRQDRRKLQDLLRRERDLARTDPLTGLANSRAFKEALRVEHARARRDGSPLCLVYFDLDNFKNVNDLYGHDAGDALLVTLSERIRDTFRATDLVARLGGDEFAVLLWDPDRESAEATVRRVLERIRDCGESYPRSRLGVSAGIAFCRKVPDDPWDLIRCADAAMYRGKTGGKGKVVVHTCSGRACRVPPALQPAPAGGSVPSNPGGEDPAPGGQDAGSTGRSRSKAAATR
ncbi:MAG: GGDEF domain-containing protein [Acidobacteria bacterium]|nr:GGDEF domain-containing protein [Acidobacteriota bacterium]